MRLIFEKLIAQKASPEEDRARLVSEIIDEQGQRILNLMRYFVLGLNSEISGSLVDEYLEQFGWLVAADASSPSGLSMPAANALLIVIARIAHEVHRELPGLTLDRLSMLLAGGPGAALAGEVMTNLILGACPSSHCSSDRESDSFCVHEQAFSPLEDRSDAAAPAERAGLRA